MTMSTTRRARKCCPAVDPSAAKDADGALRFADSLLGDIQAEHPQPEMVFAAIFAVSARFLLASGYYGTNDLHLHIVDASRDVGAARDEARPPEATN